MNNIFYKHKFFVVILGYVRLSKGYKCPGGLVPHRDKALLDYIPLQFNWPIIKVKPCGLVLLAYTDHTAKMTN